MTTDPHEWAKRAFERHDVYHGELMSASVDSAKEAIKAALLLNGGACIALLGFLAALAGNQNARTAPFDDALGFLGRLIGQKAQQVTIVEATQIGLLWFALGAFLAAATAGLAYIVNSLYAGAAAEADKTFEHPYIHANSGSKRLWWWGQCLNWVAVATCLGSHGVFLAGLWHIGSSL